MKEIIIAYLTGVINTYNENILYLKSLKIENIETLNFTRNNFVAMLDYMEETEEEGSVDIEAILFENEMLKNDIEDLQEIIKEANCSTENIHDMLFGRR